MEIDRRALLKRAGLLAGTGALAGLTGCEPDRGARPAGGTEGSGEPRRGAPVDPAAAPSGWAAMRARFDLDPGRRHFAAFVLASHPRPVADAIQRHRAGLQADPDGYLEAHGRRLDRAAHAAAEYLGGDPDGLAFTRSTTDGLGLLYGGLRLRPGQEVLTTEHDFYATHEALRLRAERTGATVRRVALYRRPGRRLGGRAGRRRPPPPGDPGERHPLRDPPPAARPQHRDPRRPTSTPPSAPSTPSPERPRGAPLPHHRRHPAWKLALDLPGGIERLHQSVGVRLSGVGLLVAEACGVLVGATVGAWEGQMLEQPSVRPP